jgi:hypothetical protein
MSDDLQEKRISQRFLFVSFAWFKRIDDAATQGEEGVARSCDISQTGTGMVTNRPLPVGSRVFLKLVSPLGNVSVLGKVMHCRGVENGCFRVGILIECVPPTDQVTWQRMMDP